MTGKPSIKTDKNNSGNENIQKDLNNDTSGHGIFFRYWKSNLEKRKWMSIQDTPDVEEQAKTQGAAYLTYIGVDRNPEKDIEPNRYGFFPMDFDSIGDVAKSVIEAKNTMFHLEDKYNVDPFNLRIYMSGGKGVHIEIPPEILGVTPGPNLYQEYKEIAKQIQNDLDLKTLDTTIYKGGKGQMFRLPNVPRDNGHYKVPVTPIELIKMSPDELTRLTETKRYLIKEHQPTTPEQAEELHDLFAQVRNEIANSPKKNNFSNTNQQDSQQKECEEILRQMDFFVNEFDKHIWVTFPVNSHLETWPANSSRFDEFLKYIYHKNFNKTVSNAALQNVISIYTGKARFEKAPLKVYTRIARDGEDVVIDMGDDDWRTIRITKQGYRVEKSSEVKFRRTDTMRPLPEPEDEGCLSDIRSLLNMSDANFVLAMSWLVGTINPSGPYPILLLKGIQGIGKTTQAEILRSILDPTVPVLRSLPKSERDLVIHAQNEWIMGFDNVGDIAPVTSDALCRLSTGGGFGTRELYSDDKEKIFASMRPIILNGIDQMAERHDLLSRCVICYLKPIPKNQRLEVKKIWQRFEELHPKILAALCKAISTALSREDTVQLAQTPRMADFAHWVVASEPSLPWNSGEFMKTYEANQSMAIQNAVGMDTVASAIVDLMDNRHEWKGNATELMASLNEQVPERTQRTKGWPAAPNSLSRRLSLIEDALRRIGIEVIHGMVGTKKQITLKWIEQNTDKTENTEKSPEKNDVPRTDTDIADSYDIDKAMGNNHFVKASDSISF